MKSILMFFVLAAAVLGVQADPKQDLKGAVDRHEVAVDHIATIGRWQYEIYVDRSRTPPVALARITKKSWEEVFKISDKEADRVLTEQSEKVQSYLDSITGTQTKNPEKKAPMKAQDGPVSCPEFFGKEWRNQTFMADDDMFLIDSQGRPQWSLIQFVGGNVQAAERDKGCQQKVGYMGIAGDEGGHLVGAAVGGWGGRGNLTPQNAAVNRTVFAPAERVVMYCAKTKGILVEWNVIAAYDDKLDISSRPVGYWGVLGASVAACPPNWNTHQLCGGPIGCPNSQPTADVYAQLNYFKESSREMCDSVAGGIGAQDWPCEG